MVNEFAYCPRLFFYEWVDGLFQESVDTVEAAIQHKRVDAKTTALPAADAAESVDSRAVRHALERAAAGDREDGPGGGRRAAIVTPVDYKHGTSARGRRRAGTLAVGPRASWRCRESCCGRTGIGARKGIVYYRKTGQRVRVAVRRRH
jgi:CRISPR-associated protein Cas1